MYISNTQNSVKYRTSYLIQGKAKLNALKRGTSCTLEEYVAGKSLGKTAKTPGMTLVL